MASRNSLVTADFDESPESCVSEELAAAWEANPRCAECGETVRSVLEAALLVGPNRVTHRERCFIPALVRGNPHLRLLATRQRAKEEGEAAPETADGRVQRTIAEDDPSARELRNG